MTSRRRQLAAVTFAALAIILAGYGAGHGQDASGAAQTQPEAAAPAADQGTVQPAGESAPSADAATPTAPAEAAQTQAPIEVPVSEAALKADGWKMQLDAVAQEIDREDIGDERIAALRLRAEEILEQARQLANELEPQINAIKARLEQLGPSPAAGEPPESADIANSRATENAALASDDSALKKVRLVIVQAEQIITEAAALRRDRFTQSLTARSRSIFNPTLWIDGFKAAPKVTHALAITTRDSWSVAVKNIDSRSAATMIAAVIMAVLLGIFIRRYVRRFADFDEEAQEVPRLQKLKRAVLIVVSDGFIPIAAVAILTTALDETELVSGRLSELNQGLISAVAIFAFLFGLARALCAPLRPGWRLVAVSDYVAAQSVIAVTGIAAVLAVANYLQTANALLFAPIEVDIAKQALSVILINILLATALWRLAKSDNSASAPGESQGIIWRWIRGVVWVVISISSVALALGYIALANFITLQLVFAGAIFAAVWLLLGIIEEVVNTILKPDSRIGRALSAMFGISESGIMQLALVASGLLRVGLIVLGIVLVAIPWGLDTGQWRSWIETALFGFRIGGVTISVTAIIAALVILVLGLIATRGIQSWLGNRFLPNTSLDLGIRNSIRTVAGYVGIVLTAIIAITYMGFNLQNVAIVAGALSVGIGFGLQSIVNNFVSGLILLAERPIKEGDWIIVGAEQGYVRKISIRSTEIETFDRATVIVPNSDLITGTVKNWMHSSMMGRVIVPLGVGYGSDPEQVRDILLAVARDHPNVLAYPEPRVYFTDFGDSALLFNLYAYIGDVNTSLTVRSDFRFEILKRMREAQIEIPFPQRDLNLRDIDRLEAALSRTGPGTAPPETGAQDAG